MGFRDQNQVANLEQTPLTVESLLRQLPTPLKQANKNQYYKILSYKVAQSNLEHATVVPQSPEQWELHAIYVCVLQ